MMRRKIKLLSFCRNRAATRLQLVRSPSIKAKPLSSEVGTGVTQSKAAIGGRIMIVVDSSPEAKSAVQWALSHAVQSHDTVVLLDVVKPSKHDDQPQRKTDARSYGLLYNMKKMCEARRPEVQVELSRVEGKERGPTIVEEAKKQKVSLLVLGQKRRSMTWRLLMIWSLGRAGGGGVVDYCIQNAPCMALAVRRKGGRAGGYVITTRRHKDFWLLA